MPSSNLSLSLPINPLSRAKVVSAGAIRKPKKHSRVWLYAQYVRRSKLYPCPRRVSGEPANLHVLVVHRTMNRINYSLL